MHFSSSIMDEGKKKKKRQKLDFYVGEIPTTLALSIDCF